MKLKFLLFPLVAMLGACAVNSSGQVGMDERVFNRQTVIPLGAGILGAVLCEKLFEGHGSKDGWTTVCGAAGYFGSLAFLSQHNQILEKNRIGETSTWTDPDGRSHTVTPTATYYEQERPCREFRQTVEIDGQVEILSGKACRGNDGEWRLVP